MRVTDIQPFGCEISDIDLREPQSDSTIGAIRDVLHERGFALFRDQDLDAPAQARFARRFGPFSGHNDSDRLGYLGENGQPPTLRLYNNREGMGRYNELDFHSDNAHAEFSLRYLGLYAIDVTTDGKPIQGGETKLADAAAALDRVPAALGAKLEAAQCRIHAQSLSSFVRPCIERHWATGRPYLVPSSLTEEIVGVSPGESDEIRETLYAIMYDPAFVYPHAWREGDLLFWDNRLVHHARNWYDNAQTRSIRRCAIADEREPTAILESPLELL